MYKKLNAQHVVPAIVIPNRPHETTLGQPFYLFLGPPNNVQRFKCIPYNKVNSRYKLWSKYKSWFFSLSLSPMYVFSICRLQYINLLKSSIIVIYCSRFYFIFFKTAPVFNFYFFQNIIIIIQRRFECLYII